MNLYPNFSIQSCPIDTPAAQRLKQLYTRLNGDPQKLHKTLEMQNDPVLTAAFDENCAWRAAFVEKLAGVPAGTLLASRRGVHGENEKALERFRQIGLGPLTSKTQATLRALGYDFYWGETNVPDEVKLLLASQGVAVESIIGLGLSWGE
jgi:hypothetical protein